MDVQTAAIDRAQLTEFSDALKQALSAYAALEAFRARQSLYLRELERSYSAALKDVIAAAGHDQRLQGVLIASGLGLSL